MIKRHDDALQAQMGASNARALITALRAAMDECEAAKVSSYNDPACRLIAHQMAHLFRVAGILDTKDYQQCVEVCRVYADAKTVAQWKTYGG